jgi:hypothetical protein
MVIRPGVNEHHAQGQPGWDGIEIGDGAWGEHGACVIHGSGETRTFEMRGDRVGVGDVGEVSYRSWSNRIKAGGHHGGRAGWEFDTGVVYGHGPDVHHSSWQPCWYGIIIHHGTRQQHGAGVVHVSDTSGSDKMRVDTVGVGDVGEMSNKTWRAWDSTGGDDGGRAGIKHDPGVVGGYGSAEHHSSGEQGRHGLGVSDGAWGEHGAGVVYKQGDRGQIKLRGDTVGVGDVGEVQGRTRGARDAFGGDDGRGAGRERESGMVIRPGVNEHHAQVQPGWDGISVSDSTWSEHGAGGVHGSGEAGTFEMRGDRVGVGDIGEMHCRAWGSRHKAGGDDGREAGWERESGLVFRFGLYELFSPDESGRDRLCIFYGPWDWVSVVCLHPEDSRWAHGKRGDRLGVRFVCALSFRISCARKQTYCDYIN